MNEDILRLCLVQLLNIINSDRIDSDRIDSARIDFERIDLCLDTIT